MQFIINLPYWLIIPFVPCILFYRKLRYGYPFLRIPLTEGKFAIVDPEDYKKLTEFDWHYSPDFYACAARTIDGKRKLVRMQRMILPVGDSLVVDHKNHNKLDNRKANLRAATSSQNACNRKPKPHSSRFKGVNWCKKDKRWRAAIVCNKKYTSLGYFTDEAEAGKAYDAAAKKYYGEFANLNFPES